MSRLDRAIGLARSLAIYHGIPFRQRRMRRLYRQFVRPGDVVFDIGAHVGNRVRAFAALGCRVVAVEPQPDCVAVLRMLFGRRERVQILQAAVSDTVGRAVLSISERTPTVATVRDSWRDARAGESDFDQVRWTRRIGVDTTTLDCLIAEFGVPSFIKIDVEGAEAAVLSALSQAVPALSFEYLPRALGDVEAALTRLIALGPYRFTWSIGETYRLAAVGPGRASWVNADQLLARLGQPGAARRSGDVYAVLDRARDTGDRR